MGSIVSVELIIGMEVHVELCTATKMFSRAVNAASAAHDALGPNEAIDPVVLGLPGALPVLNKRAISLAMSVGMALGCSIARQTKWDRKGYFYPDLPKGYQISQYDLPLCFDGSVTIEAGAGSRQIGIIRAHLEEDAGKLLHEAPGGAAIDCSIVDLNRAGTPLLEIVTAPDFRSADECVEFAQMLRTLCRFLRASEGVLQRGHMRFEPNINCILTLDDGHTVKTPIVEVKNLNSFKALRGCIEYELREQPLRWQREGRVMTPGTKTTRGWDDAAGCTVLQREKEEAADYRYFPDPDLLPVTIDDAWQNSVLATLPEPPHTKQRRFINEFALSDKEAAALTDERDVCDLYEKTIDTAAQRGVSRHKAARLAANLLLQSGAKRANERTAAKIGDEGQLAAPVLVAELGVNAGHLAEIIALRDAGRISAHHADDLFGLFCEEDNRSKSAEQLAQEHAMLLVRDDGAIDAWVQQAIAANDKAAEDVRQGKDQAIGRIVGAAMKLAGGQADAATLRERILKALGRS